MINYEFLEQDDNFLYTARETGKTHSNFAYELELYHALQNGDIDAVKLALEVYQRQGLIIGHMSNNELQQIHYWAVAAISIAIHYAILGGLDESKAYQLSDQYIQKVDTLNSMEECIDYLCSQVLKLCKEVKDSKELHCYSSLINQCIHYINIHLHERLKIQDLANHLHVSRDYLSTSFKKEVNISLHQFIMDCKLKEAKQLLIQGKSINEISYTLCFSNESHFIQLFKKKYGITPIEYLKQVLPSD